ncbi:helix-turn-helix transcriptional regulator [Yersinia sp. 2545 StPb PI]|uniref:helix-turn-helix transcriptional regulator n=1 Tax=unclassified Yersinia (in: enterobacteria) TaxID=2653513 RepID=UPI003FA43CE5
MSILIYSDSALISFFLQSSLENNVLNIKKSESNNLIICESLSSLEKNIYNDIHPMIIIDVDNIGRIDLYRLFHFIELKNGRILIFTKKNEASNGYIAMQKESPFIMSKESSLNKMEKDLYNFIYNPNFFLRKNNFNTAKKTLLTPREMEICSYMFRGMSSKDIAIQLNISVKTVFTHRKNIKTKYKSKNIIDLYMKINRL